MSKDVFTAGVERGAPSSAFEVRVLICWLLDSIDRQVTMWKINRALQNEALVNYFELARCISELISSGHIVECEHSTGEDAPLALTEKGHETARVFENKIPLSVREKSLEALRAVLQRDKIERENRVTMRKQNGGWELSLQISDVGSDLMNLSLYVPTEEMCLSMRSRFLDDPGKLYMVVADYLSGGQMG